MVQVNTPVGLPCDVCGKSIVAKDEVVAIPDGLALFGPSGRCLVGIPGYRAPGTASVKAIHRDCLLAYVDGLFARLAVVSRGKDPFVGDKKTWHFKTVGPGEGLLTIECRDCGFVGAVEQQYICQRCQREVCAACHDEHRC